jgi:sortase A
LNKPKQSLGKPSLITLLSLGVMVFGAGCISWVMFSMWTQANSDYYAGAAARRSPIVTAPVAERKKVTKDGVTPVKTDDLSPSLNGNTTLYPKYPAVGDNIGSLTIPALKRKLPIIEGTGVKELKKGVGHFIQSVLPGEKDNCVISGHRDTVFRQLGKLKIGDELIVQTRAGVFTYKVSGTRIVHQDDRTVIVPTKSAILTMTTCYPFNFIGSAPDRYIVSATLVKIK